MNQQNARALTLHDLLARRWQAAAPVVGLSFNADGSAAAFATADGSVLIASAPDAEPPETRIRVTGDLGQITIRPRTADPAPLVAVSGLADGPPPLAAAGREFLAGCGDGRILRLAIDGGAEAFHALDGPVIALDQAAGVAAAADPSGFAIVGPEGARRRPLDGLRALALSGDGRRLAASGAARLHLLDLEAETGHGVPMPDAQALAWRDDGAWVAAACGAGGAALVGPAAVEPVRLGDFPAPARSLAWSGPARAFVSAGAFRVAAWDSAALPLVAPQVAGRAGLVAVEAVAVHPARPLVAAGYANGQVTIAQVGSRDELMLRHEGAAVACLCFSPDGRHLAIGDVGGGAAIASFPPQMFK